MSRRRKTLSAEDRDLWNRVAASATPMDPAARKRIALPFASGEKPVASRPDAVHPFRLDAATSPRTGLNLAPSVSERVNAAPVRMHHGTHKKMVRGKLKPEARLDLHGMTLARAHPALTGFILEAHAAGKRLVLVITGKGRDRDDDGPIPIRRGALRHQVPGWLRSPPLGAMVLDIRTAHVRHGGDGAYYVYLARKR